MSLKKLMVESLRVVLPVGILAAGFAGFSVLGTKEPPVTRPEIAPPPLLVKTVAVEPHPAGLNLEADGLVIPFREVVVAAEVAGRVTYKSPNCRAGCVVKRGERLFEIDRQTYELDVQRLDGELAQAEASLGELAVELKNTNRLIELAREQLALQKKNTERMARLSARDVTTPAELDEARRNEVTANNSLLNLTNEVEHIAARRNTQVQSRDLAAVKLARAQLDLDRTAVIAPMDGIVLSNDVEESSYVQPGQALVKLEDTAAVEVRCNLRMDEVQWVLRQPRTEKTGASSSWGYQLPPTPVTIRYRIGGQSYEWQGVLNGYDGVGVDERTRTVPVRVLVREPQQVRTVPSMPEGNDPGPRHAGPPALVRGMYVQAILHVQTDAKLLALPDRVIQPGQVVWRAKDGKLDIVPITIAQVQNSRVLIDRLGSSLMAGDHLIMSPIAAPVAGMAVREEVAE